MRRTWRSRTSVVYGRGRRSCTELLLVARRRHARSLREGGVRYALVVEHGRNHVGRPRRRRKAPLGLEQAQRHQHLLRRGVVSALELAQEVERGEPRHAGQRVRSVMRLRARVARASARSSGARSTQALLARAWHACATGAARRPGSRSSASKASGSLAIPELAQRRPAPGAAASRPTAIGEPPAALAVEFFQQRAVDVDHAVAPWRRRSRRGLCAVRRGSSAPTCRPAPGALRHGSGSAPRRPRWRRQGRSRLCGEGMPHPCGRGTAPSPGAVRRAPELAASSGCSKVSGTASRTAR